MMKKFKNKYLIPSIRLSKWNYGWQAPYFITICTHRRTRFFGEIVDGKMHLSEIGEIANQEWIKTIEMRPDMNLKMGEYIVMPDHFHAVIIIGKNPFNRTDAMHCVSTVSTGKSFSTVSTGKSFSPKDLSKEILSSEDLSKEILSPEDLSKEILSKENSNSIQNQFGPQSKNLASIIRGFKSSVTTYARKNGMKDFKWQSRFYEHIIRDEQSFNRIQKYIINNPAKWVEKK